MLILIIDSQSVKIGNAVFCNINCLAVECSVNARLKFNSGVIYWIHFKVFEIMQGVKF